MSATTETVFDDLVAVDVVARHPFYNNSAFDGYNAAATAADDLAVALDKTGLLPGGVASFANYTSYDKGLNGLVIDMAGLPSTTLALSDFEFRVGNRNGPATWSPAPEPTSIIVRAGAGQGGAARVQIVWPDGAIVGQWLQVTVKATTSTGLDEPDVFYLGNAPGESGNSAGDAIVDAGDQAAAQNGATTNAPVANLHDYNRDGRVDAADVSVAAANATTGQTALVLLDAPAIVPQATVERGPLNLFNRGDADIPVFNAPVMVTTNSGAVVAMAEGRHSVADLASYAVVMRRSTDGGVTWSTPAIIYAEPDTGGRIGSPTPVVDTATGDIFVIFTRDNDEVLLSRSSDDGLTWSAPEDITSGVKVTASGNPGPAGVWADDPWGWYAIGPGHGITLQHGAHAGRLLVAADHRLTGDFLGTSWTHVIYSDDHGQTWHLGGGLAPNPDGSPTLNNNSNEAALVELSDGTVYMSVRHQSSPNSNRGQSRSYDGGITWDTLSYASGIVSVKVEGSLLRLNEGVLLYASPSRVDSTRIEMTIWASYNEAQSWIKMKTVYFGPSGYSDMALVGPDTLLLVYARGNVGGSLDSGGDNSELGLTSFNSIGLARINLRWLASTDPYQFAWYFNEQAPGTPANTDGPSIRDYGQWNAAAWPLASSSNMAPQYVAGRDGDSALALTENDDRVVLTQGATRALHLRSNDSLTVEMVLRTTDDDGVIIGTVPTIANWTLRIIGGKLHLSVYDTVNSASITSDAPINDGQWHRIAAVRDAAGKRLRLYVDGVEAAAAAVDTTTLSLVTDDPVILGAYNTAVDSHQLAFEVDSLRITRAALKPAELLPDAFVHPGPPAATEYPANGPASIAGLQFWLPPYDPAAYFSDFGNYTDALPLTAFAGMATRSMREQSDNNYQVSSVNYARSIQYGNDAALGPYWTFSAAPGMMGGSELWVHGSSGAGNSNFDFVQNTGVFTLSAFVNVGDATGGYMTLFDTSEGSTDNPGFTLLIRQDGTLYLGVSGGAGQPIRYSGDSPSGGALSSGQWYHVAVVGSGPGNPVVFYVTPASAGQVAAFAVGTLTGSDGAYPTDADHDLFIGGRSSTTQGAGGAPFNGRMVNQAIYNRALSPGEIEKLFTSGKGLRGIDVVAIEHQSLTHAVAEYRVGNPGALAGDYAATIAWGDGNITAGSIAIVDGLLTVSGSHAYIQQGTYPLLVTLTGNDGTNATATSTANVGNSLEAHGVDLPGLAGQALTRPVASFIDVDGSTTAGDFIASIAWGDGDVSPGTVTYVDGAFVVVGSHVYAAAGSYTMDVTIDAIDGRSAHAEATAHIGALGNVVDRRLFYYKSPRFDVAGPEWAPLPYDHDNAIAPDKSAYLPGSGLAVFNNVSSYSRGINGITIDVAGSHPDITLADFVFRVGNNNAPATWSIAPVPVSLTVRPGAGAGGSDRIEIIWPDKAVANTWLEVQMLPTANTGLSSPHVFFWGSKIGDVGNPTPTAFTTSASGDAAAVVTRLGAASGIADVYDFDRTNSITVAGDRAIAAANVGAIVRLNIGQSFPLIQSAPAATTLRPVATPDVGIASSLAVASAQAGTLTAAPMQVPSTNNATASGEDRALRAAPRDVVSVVSPVVASKGFVVVDDDTFAVQLDDDLLDELSAGVLGVARN